MTTIVTSFDPVLSFRFVRVGSSDPTCRLSADCFEKAFWTPQGACTMRIYRDRVEALGEGAEWCLANCPLTFRPLTLPPNVPHNIVAEASRRLAGLQLMPLPWVSDLASAVILQQRVTFGEASQAYRQIAIRWGEVSPCGNLRLPLARRQWLSLTTAHLGSLGIDQKRAVTLLRAADLSNKLNALFGKSFEEARSLLSKIPGIGPWTREMLMGFALADPDAVPTGDLHLPHAVTKALTGKPWGSDELMIELLEPYRGQRFRVIRWIMCLSRS